jgi:hypothetical protein
VRGAPSTSRSPRANTRTPRVYQQKVRLAGRTFRQVYILDLGHELPTILVTNDEHVSITKLITRYAHRMLIENALSDAVRFFHMDASPPRSASRWTSI